MQLKRKGKGLLYLIAIAVLISTLFIACKNRATGIYDDGTATPDPVTLSSFTLGNTSEYLEGYYFESASYDKKGGGKFKFKVQIIGKTDSQGFVRVLKFTGFGESGNLINREYNITNPTNPNGQYGDNERYHAVTLLNGSATATAVFSKDGYLTFKPSDFAEAIKLAIKAKTTEDKTGQS